MSLSALVALVVALTLCLDVVAQEVMDGPGAAEAKAKADEAASREIFQAVQRLRAAVQDEKKGEEGGGVPCPRGRNGRSTPPTLTPAELDRLLETVPGEDQSQGRDRARSTSDVEFVRRVYLDLAGKLPTPEQVRRLRRRTASKDKRAQADRRTCSAAPTTPGTGPATGAT